MNFNLYIFASIVSHLLLIGFLYLTHADTEIHPDIFNVEIVAPEEGVSVQPPPPPFETKKPPRKPLRRKPPEESLPPDTLYEEKTEVPREAVEDARTEEESEPAKNDESLSGEEEPLMQDMAAPPEKGEQRVSPRTFLFDKTTIDKFAREGSAAKKGLTFDTTGFRHRGYMRMLKERIEDIWKYPKEAAQRGLSGDLYIKFSITKDGKLGETEIVRTSGHRELDEAAMKALKNAEPFWPLPDDWEKDTLEIKGHFIYVFGDTFVM